VADRRFIIVAARKPGSMGDPGDGMSAVIIDGPDNGHWLLSF
jgi:hypothetical protein